LESCGYTAEAVTGVTTDKTSYAPKGPHMTRPARKQERDYSKYPLLKWVSTVFAACSGLALLATIGLTAFLLIDRGSASRQDPLITLGAIVLSGLLFALLIGAAEVINLLVDLERHARQIAEQGTKPVA
jgi:hypothetical protein